MAVDGLCQQHFVACIVSDSDLVDSTGRTDGITKSNSPSLPMNILLLLHHKSQVSSIMTPIYNLVFI